MYEMMVESKLKEDRKEAEVWRLRHLKSVERRLLEAGGSAVIKFLRGAYSALRAHGAARPAREQPIY